MSLVSYVQQDEVLEITFNRPKKLNAFNDELIDETLDILEKASNLGVRLVSFLGEGKGFSGGFDLTNIENMTDADLLLRFVKIEKMLQSVYDAQYATVAFVHGACYGAAADLVAACQWRVGTPDSLFRMPGPRFGLVLGTGRLRKLVGEDRVRKLILRDIPFDAYEAIEMGFLTEISGRDEWSNKKNDIASRVSAVRPLTYNQLLARQRSDESDSDMAELVRSATNGSIKKRIISYLKEISIKTNS